MNREAMEKKSVYQRVVTWNVQRMSLGTVNKVKARAAAEIARNHKFDVVLLSEVRADCSGIEYLGINENQVIILLQKLKKLVWHTRAANLAKWWLDLAKFGPS